MKKALFAFACFCIMSYQTQAQQNSTLPAFEQIRVGQSIHVELIYADRHSIYIEPEEMASFVKASVTNGTLNIELSEAKANKSVKVKLYLRKLTRLEAEGASEVYSNDTFSSENIHIRATGAAKINLLLNTTNLKAEATGAALINLTGHGELSLLNASGAANIKASTFQSETVLVESDGAASVKVYASESLTTRSAGASKIIFYGKPKNRSVSVKGVSTVKDYEDNVELDNEIKTFDNGNSDTTRVKIGKRKLIIIDDGEAKSKDETNKRRSMKSVWSGFALGVQGLTTSSMKFNMPVGYDFLNTKVGSSWFFDLNPFEIDGHIFKNKLAITTGLGLTFNNIHFESNDYLTPNAKTLSATPSDTNTSLSTNKLYTFDLTAPLLIKFAPGNKKSAKKGFHIATGVVLHYVAVSKVITETSSQGYLNRTTYTDDFNINPFRLDATLRIGYDRIKFFANYSLTPFFDNSKAPDIRLFSGGITLIGF